MADKIKILYVNGGTMDRGGISSYMMNYYRHFDKTKLCIDFLTQGSGINLYGDEIDAGGGKIFQIPNKGKNVFKNLFSLYKVIKNGGYDIVHTHADAGNGIILAIAKLSGVKVRISHSHSTNFYTQSKFKRVLNNLQKKCICKYATVFWGCSEQSCEFLYPTITDYKVVNNAIDLTKFKFDQATRNIIRKQLKIDDECLAVCQIGHFNYIKNHKFSLEIARNIKLIYPNFNFKMFFVGDGEDRSIIESIVEQYSLSTNVELLGTRNDISDFLQGMDIMLLPSLFEGFPVTMVESQASGVYTIVSDTVTRGACFDDLRVTYLPIVQNSIYAWVDLCKNFCVIDRNDAYLKAREAGFDIEIEAKKIQEAYVNLVKEVSI